MFLNMNMWYLIKMQFSYLIIIKEFFTIKGPFLQIVLFEFISTRSVPPFQQWCVTIFILRSAWSSFLLSRWTCWIVLFATWIIDRLCVTFIIRWCVRLSSHFDINFSSFQNTLLTIANKKKLGSYSKFLQVTCYFK